MSEHTPEPWRDGKGGRSIVADSDQGREECGYPNELEHYGGHLIAESIAPCNKPLIKAAPVLLAACERGKAKGIDPDLLLAATIMFRDEGWEDMALAMEAKAEAEQAAIDAAKGE